MPSHGELQEPKLQVTGFDEHRYSESARFILDQAGMNFLNCNVHCWPFETQDWICDPYC